MTVVSLAQNTHQNILVVNSIIRLAGEAIVLLTSVAYWIKNLIATVDGTTTVDQLFVSPETALIVMAPFIVLDAFYTWLGFSSDIQYYSQQIWVQIVSIGGLVLNVVALLFIEFMTFIGVIGTLTVGGEVT